VAGFRKKDRQVLKRKGVAIGEIAMSEAIDASGVTIVPELSIHTPRNGVA
jgi:hypothetical protein